MEMAPLKGIRYPRARIAHNNKVFKRIGFKPHKLQRSILSCAAPIIAHIGSRRLGKSYNCHAQISTRFSWACRTPTPKGQSIPWAGMVLAPTKDQFHDIWVDLLANIPREWLFDISETHFRFKLRGTDVRPWGEVTLRSSKEWANLQGKGLNYLHVAESQNVDERATTRLFPAMVSAGRAGDIFCEGMPPLSTNHWFARLWHEAKESVEMGDKDFWWAHGTYEDNPYLTPEDIRRIMMLKRVMRRAEWERMFLAEFSASAMYFHNYAACIDRTAEMLDMPIRGRRYVAGLDLGRIVNPSVMVIYDALTRKVVHVVCWDEGDLWDHQKERIRELHATWNFEQIMTDATGGGDSICEDLERAGVPINRYVYSTNSRRDLLLNLALSMEKLTISYPRHERLIEELRAFQHVLMPSGLVRLQAPAGEHDDAVMALALGLLACDPPLEMWDDLFYDDLTYVDLPDGYKGGYSGFIDEYEEAEKQRLIKLGADLYEELVQKETVHAA